MIESWPQATGPSWCFTLLTDFRSGKLSSSGIGVASARYSVFRKTAGVSVGVKDTSLAGRISAAFPEHLTADQRQPNDLADLGELVKRPNANAIKFPSVSASVPQLVAAVKELQAKG